MSDDTQTEGYDHTPEGRELVALLQKYAPPAVDSRKGAQAVMARLGGVRPRARLHLLIRLAPVTAAAALVAVALLIFTPPPEQPETPAPVAKHDDAPAPTHTDIRRERGYPEIVATVRGSSGDGLLIDAGAKDGLRVGDELSAAGGVKARVTAVGIFEARISADGPLSRGAEVRARAATEAQQRAAGFAEFGGDPGAFLEFGALVSAMPLADARMLGISDGAALRVDETLPALLRDPQSAPAPTLAAQLDLRAGDVIIEVNGSHVRTLNDFGQALGWSRDPRLLTVRILRNGKQLDLRL